MKTMSLEEYKACKEYEDRIHHAKVVAETLAKDKDFIKILAKEIAKEVINMEMFS